VESPLPGDLLRLHQGFVRVASLLVGIAGGSGSGKTTLAKGVAEAYAAGARGGHSTRCLLPRPRSPGRSRTESVATSTSRRRSTTNAWSRIWADCAQAAPSRGRTTICDPHAAGRNHAGGGTSGGDRGRNPGAGYSRAVRRCLDLKVFVEPRNRPAWRGESNATWRSAAAREKAPKSSTSRTTRPMHDLYVEPSRASRGPGGFRRGWRREGRGKRDGCHPSPAQLGIRA
jgi:hypothetical protein